MQTQGSGASDIVQANGKRQWAARACDGDVAAVWERRGNVPEHTEFFARCALVELA